MLWRDLKAWQIYGANTDVGKTILSTILAKALARRASANGLLYLKPVSTGPQNEADDRHIHKYVPGVLSKCIVQFAEPVSPHLAARGFTSARKVPKTDAEILTQVKRVLNDHSESGGRFAVLETAGGVLSPAPSGSIQADVYRPLRLPTLLMGDSKLGGIGTTISAFESLSTRGYDVESVLLFDDPKWGNHAFLQEHFLKHNVPAFALPPPPPKQANEQDDQLMLAEYYNQCSSSPTISNLISLLQQNHFTRVSKLTSMSAHADSVIWHPFRQHQLPQNIIAIDSAYGDHFEAYDPEQDSALEVPATASPSGLSPLTAVKPQPSILTPLFDASASWWTQGLGHGNAALALTAAHAAGRYGHVMFASAVHEPALDLSFNLLSTLQNPRLSRVFFTDNGSTGMEVAVKMALRATCHRYGWEKTDLTQPVGILGLRGSYHGDTIGVMNCSEPSTFNEKVDWYRPWGHWFEPPEIQMRQGKWHINLPTTMAEGYQSQTYDSLESIFDFSSRGGDAVHYKEFIMSTLTDLVHNQKCRFGALILEPLVMGAGGMIFVDPLFQRTLITTIRENPELIAPSHDHAADIKSSSPLGNDPSLTWRGLPFIADEVFTGLYRLGRSSSSSFLNKNSSNKNTTRTASGLPPAQKTSFALDLDIAPDISVHAKLLTGGLLPLALTTASASIFNTFLSDSKADALLHGHSYTAHPIGCAVANKSLEEMTRLDQGGSWATYKESWAGVSSTGHHILSTSTSTLASPSTTTPSTPSSSSIQSITRNPTAPIFSFFNPETLTEISNHPRIDSCFALGTVLALNLKPTNSSQSGEEGGGGGYTSNAASSLQATLLASRDEDGAGVHSRVLGNVIYFMTSLVTPPDVVRRLEGSILSALDRDV